MMHMHSVITSYEFASADMYAAAHATGLRLCGVPIRAKLGRIADSARSYCTTDFGLHCSPTGLGRYRATNLR
jgi:hypothetical protein